MPGEREGQPPLRVLVTGANGLAGSAVVRRVLAAGHEPVALLRPGADETLLPPGTERLYWQIVQLSPRPSDWALYFPEFHAGEAFEAHAATGTPVTHPEEASRVFSEARADAVVHCAAVVSTGKPDLAESFRMNVEVTRLLLAAAEHAGLRRWVQVSSMSAHPENRSIYGGTKWQQELAVRQSRLSWAVLRPGLIYGPQRRGIFARLAQIVAKWNVVPLPNGGNEPAAAVHVDDFADAALRAAQEDTAANQCFELGGAERWTFRELVQTMADVLGRKPALLTLPLPLCRLAAIAGEAVLPRPPLTTDNLEGLLTARWPDITAAREVLGFSPRPFAEGFRECLDKGLLPAEPTPIRNPVPRKRRRKAKS